MKRMLINATQHDEVRVAITDGPLLIDLDIEVLGHEQKKSNIYKGIISSIEPSLGAVFVNYGSERHGFLPLKEISREYFLGEGADQQENPDIRKVLREGQPLVVQIEKEERGTKGAALTTYISLAGSYLVLMPNNPTAGGISRRIEGEDRDQLRSAITELNLPEEMGVIIRTAGVGKQKEELEWDLNILLRYWEAIKQAATLKQGPYLIHQESNVVIRAIRDNLRQDIEEIIIDDETSYQRAYEYISQIRPDFIPRLKLYKDALPLFSRFQIEQQIETAFQREVRLPSGGSLVIDHTEALVAVDINSARATKGSNIEETALNINLEAADEIARQLRIRDIGGLVVIDFIDMTPVRNQREVENRLRHALRHDRARIQIGRISRFGLMEMSRQRIRSSLTKSNHMTCPRCEGQGTVRSIESTALSIIHLLQEQAAKSKYATFQLQLPVDLATFVANEKRELISELEKQTQVKIIILPNELLQSPHYHIKHIKGDAEHAEAAHGMASYKLLKSIKAEAGTTKKSGANKSHSEPAINQFLSSGMLSSTPSPAARAAASQSLIKRLWSKMFGAEASDTAPAVSPSRAPATSEDRQPRRSGNHRRRRGGQRSHDGGQRSHEGGQRHERGGERRGERGGERGERRHHDDRGERHAERHDRSLQTAPMESGPTETQSGNERPAASERQGGERQGGRTRRGSRGGSHRRQHRQRNPQAGPISEGSESAPVKIENHAPVSEREFYGDEDDNRGNK